MQAQRRGGKARGARRGRCRVIAICLALVATQAAAQTPWDGPYLETGIGVIDNHVALAGNRGRVDGHARRQGLWRSDAGFVALGYAWLQGPLRYAAEIELQPGSQPMAPDGGCRLGQACARTNLVGRLGPAYRLRARLAYAVAPGVAVSVGGGLSAARLRATHVVVGAASASESGAVLVRARSPFAVEALARGGHVVVGINQALSPRVTLGLALLYERLHATAPGAVGIAVVTASGASHADVTLAHQGDVRIDSSALRLSLTWRF